MNYQDYYDDQGFKNFAANLKKAIALYPEVKGKEAVYNKQKEQLETLCALEGEFVAKLLETPEGADIFGKFIKFITEEKKNILAARPYFRERQTTFTDFVSDIFRNKDAVGLTKYHFNYIFVLFVMSHGGKEIVGIDKVANKIDKLRTEIIIMNLPLAISRAHLFWRKTPHAHLTYLDLIQIATEGLASAVDKYVLPYSAVFRSVIIGRILGNCIDKFSETVLHFYPNEKRKIYRANKAISKLGGIANVDYEALAYIVNTDCEEIEKTNAAEIADLMAAASCVSADDGSIVSNTEYYGCESNEDCRPDLKYEGMEVEKVLGESIETLSIFDRKLLKLKGVDV